MSDDGSARGGILGWFVDHSVAANLLMLVLVVGGLLSITRLKQEVFPEVTLPVVTIQVPLPGASPRDVETGVLLPIEEAVQGIDGVEEVRSVAAEGVGVVAVELQLDADSQQLFADIDGAVGRITSFPRDAEEPVVSLATNRRKVISLVFHGDASEAALRAMAEQARDELIVDPRVSFVELRGVRPLEISIEVPRDQLRRYGITLAEIAQRVDAASVEIPGGEVETEGGEILLRTAARREIGDELRGVVVVAEPDGTRVRLDEIATIEDGFRDTDESAWFDGQPAARVEVFRVGEETPNEVSAAVNEYAEARRASLPPGVSVTTWGDQSQIFRDRVDLLGRNGLLGLLLVLAVLGIALEPRLSFWVTLGIPISFVGSLLVLPALGVSINIISLFAFIITLGLVVDDAIVVGESIHHRREQGDGQRDASVRGARAVARPVLFAIATTCIAFSPMLFVPGVAGKLFLNIPVVVILVLACSLVESLLVLPAHLSHPMPRPLAWLLRPWLWLMGKLGGARAERGLQWLVDRTYVPAARWALRWRYLTVAAAVALLMGAGGLWVGDRLDFTFLPKIQDDEVTATLELPVGTRTNQTEAVMERMVEAAHAAAADTEDGDDLVRGIYGQVGAPAQTAERLLQQVQQGGGHVASVMVDLGPAGGRATSSRQFVERWREQLGEVAGAERLVFGYTTGASSGADIDLEVSHPDEDRLYDIGSEIAAALGGYAGVRDVDDGHTPGKDQLDLRLTPRGRAVGLTEAALARQVRGAFFGAEAYRVQRGRNEVRVYVRLPEAQRRSLEHVEELVLQTPAGGEIPLVEAAEVERTRAYTAIERVDGRRVVHVTANVYGDANANDVTAELMAGRVAELERRHPDLRVAPAGDQEQQKEALTSLGVGYGIALVAMFALLAVAFRSYTQPLVVMAAIPFGAVGAVLGHLLLGYDFSLSSIFGLVALSGVVVNDSLLWVTTANEGREARDEPLDETLVRAGARRFRPILMTSLTTFLGLAPMIFETSVQARFLIPMALSLGFGILFATPIILLLVPCLYRILEDAQALTARALDRVFGEHAEPADAR